MLEYTEQNPTARAIDYMIAQDCKTFSVTRVDSCGYGASTFLNELGCLHLRGDWGKGIHGHSGNFINADNPSNTYAKVIIFGDADFIRVSDITNRLAKMVKDSPEGELAELLKKAYDTHWGGKKEFDKFMAKVKEDGTPIRLGHNPVFYTDEEIKIISELFLPPSLIAATPVIGSDGSYP